MKDTEILKQKNNMKFLFKLLFTVSILYSAEAYSWGIIGHRTIAEIAENHISNKSKRKLKKIIGKQNLAYIANWPDFVKSDTLNTYKETEVWHYVNVKPNQNFTEFEKSLKELSTPNLYNQIIKQKEIIANKNSSKEEKIVALKFLVHLMGDLHQPMHVGRAEDLGGNLIQLTFNRDQTNLHSLWDTKLVDYQRYSYKEFAKVLDYKSKEEIQKIQSGTLENWLYDSYTKANKIYTQTKPNGVYSYDYNYKFSGLLEEQLLAGGLRLAKVLDEILQ